MTVVYYELKDDVWIDCQCKFVFSVSKCFAHVYCSSALWRPGFVKAFCDLMADVVQSRVC